MDDKTLHLIEQAIEKGVNRALNDTIKKIIESLAVTYDCNVHHEHGPVLRDFFVDAFVTSDPKEDETQ